MPSLKAFMSSKYEYNQRQSSRSIKLFLVNYTEADIRGVRVYHHGIRSIDDKTPEEFSVIDIERHSTKLFTLETGEWGPGLLHLQIEMPDGNGVRIEGGAGYSSNAYLRPEAWAVVPDYFIKESETHIPVLLTPEGSGLHVQGWELRCVLTDKDGNLYHGEALKPDTVLPQVPIPRLKAGVYSCSISIERGKESKTFTTTLTVLGDSTHVTPPDPKPDPKPVDHPKPKVDDLVITAIDELELGLNETKTLAVKLSNHGAVAFQGLTLHSNSDGKSIKGLPSSTLDVPGNTTVTHDYKIEPVEYGATALDIAVTIPGTPPAEKHKEKRTKVYVTPPRREGLDAVAKFKAHWRKTAGEPDFIYSYNIDLSSKTTDVSSWAVSFHLPKGAHLNDSVLSNNKSWVTLNREKTTEQFVYLQSVPGNVIHAGAHVSLDIQIVYPSEQKQYEELKGVTLSKHE